MRALIVADVVGGVRTFVADLARGLSEAGVEVHLALLGSKGPAPGELAGLHVASLEVRDLRLEWMQESWSDVQATGDWVDELIARHRPDVVHMNTFAPVRAPAVPVVLTIHSCVLTWWRAVHREAAPEAWRRYALLVHRALDRASVVVAPTRALLEAVRAEYGPLPTAAVIANGRDLPPAPLGERDRLAVSVGRLWDLGKNAALVAAAAPLIGGQVVLVGEGEVAGAPKAAGVGLRTTGPLENAEVLAWLRRAAVFVEPARYEPFGLAALEAARCGCALILGDIPSLREVWGKAAIFVCPDDPQAVAAAVGALLDDPRRRARLAAAARRRSLRYTGTAMRDGYLEVYRTLSETAMAA